MAGKLHRGSVFILAGEGHRGLTRRLKALQRTRYPGLSNAKIYISQAAVTLTDEASATRAEAEIKRLAELAGEKPELIIVDTLHRAFGGGDENSAAGMGQYFGNVDRHLRLAFDAAVGTVHHSGLGDKSRTRGSNSLKASCDVEMRCERYGNRVALVCSRMKDGQEFKPIAFEILQVDVSDGDATDDGANSFVLMHVDAEIAPLAAQSTKGLGRNGNALLADIRTLIAQKRAADDGIADDHVQPVGVMLVELQAFTKVEQNRFREALEPLISRKLVREEGGYLYLA